MRFQGRASPLYFLDVIPSHALALGHKMRGQRRTQVLILSSGKEMVAENPRPMQTNLRTIGRITSNLKSQDKIAQQARESERREQNDRWSLIINAGQLVVISLQLIVFVLQLLVFRDQAKKLRDTVDAAAEQSRDMKKSIAESARAANAMDQFAKSAAVASQAATESVANQKETMTRLLRAYLCVNFGAAFFQNNIPGSPFEVQLLLINAGQTPAYRVRFKARIDILPCQLPQDFDFEVVDNPEDSESTLGGHAPPITLTKIMSRLCSEKELAEVRSGSKRLYVFGTVNYCDVYQIPRYANFCYHVAWLQDRRTSGLLTRRHNDSD
jgi:Sec-independent protein translocase protein TatA